MLMENGSERVEAMRLIDADALKKEIAKRTPHFAQRIEFTPCFKAIRDAPTVDAVPVVMCKDCKHFKKPLSPDMWGWCKKMDNKATVEDWYCADGERREE